MTTALVLAVALTGWCNDEAELVPENFLSKTQIQVWISNEEDNLQEALTTVSPKVDGTKGVNIPIVTLERYTRMAIHTINTMSVGMPILVYAGQAEPEDMAGGDDIILESAASSTLFNFLCGNDALACYSNPGVPGTASIQFRGTSAETLWRTTPTYDSFDRDFTGTLVHELFHVFGLLHSQSPSDSDCGCGLPQHPTTNCDDAEDPRSIMNVDHVGPGLVADAMADS